MRFLHRKRISVGFSHGKIALKKDGKSVEIEIMKSQGETSGAEGRYKSLNNRESGAPTSPQTGTYQLEIVKLPRSLNQVSSKARPSFGQRDRSRNEGSQSTFQVIRPPGDEADVEDYCKRKDREIDDVTASSTT
jgi:hypothetical protein